VTRVGGVPADNFGKQEPAAAVAGFRGAPSDNR
jgi:hypothetical protein